MLQLEGVALYMNVKTCKYLGTNHYFSNGGGGGVPFFKGLDTIFF